VRRTVKAYKLQCGRGNYRRIDLHALHGFALRRLVAKVMD
jgi:hypothetical protein